MRDCRTKGEAPYRQDTAFGSAETIRCSWTQGVRKDMNGDSALSWASWHLRPDAILRMLCSTTFPFDPKDVTITAYLLGAIHTRLTTTKVEEQHEVCESGTHTMHPPFVSLLPRMTVALTLAGDNAVVGTLSAAPPDRLAPAKYEPLDGTTYHGVCLPGYWNADEFARQIARYQSAVGDGLPLRAALVVCICQEQGKWRTWHWMNQTPDGGRSAVPRSPTPNFSRKHGLVPVIAWTWMETDQGRSPRLQDLVAGELLTRTWTTGSRD